MWVVPRSYRSTIFEGRTEPRLNDLTDERFTILSHTALLMHPADIGLVRLVDQAFLP